MPAKATAPKHSARQGRVKSGMDVYVKYGVLLERQCLDEYQLSLKPEGAGKETVLQARTTDGKQGLDQAFEISIPHIPGCIVRIPRNQFITCPPSDDVEVVRPPIRISASQATPAPGSGTALQPIPLAVPAGAGPAAALPQQAPVPVIEQLHQQDMQAVPLGQAELAGIPAPPQLPAQCSTDRVAAAPELKLDADRNIIVSGISWHLLTENERKELQLKKYPEKPKPTLDLTWNPDGLRDLYFKNFHNGDMKAEVRTQDLDTCAAS